jgi:hypothetical protein
LIQSKWFGCSKFDQKRPLFAHAQPFFSSDAQHRTQKVARLAKNCLETVLSLPPATKSIFLRLTAFRFFAAISPIAASKRVLSGLEKSLFLSR